MGMVKGEGQRFARQGRFFISGAHCISSKCRGAENCGRGIALCARNFVLNSRVKLQKIQQECGIPHVGCTLNLWNAARARAVVILQCFRQ